VTCQVTEEAMFTVTAAEDIHRSPSEVFFFAGDYRNDPAWRTGVTEMIIEGTDSLAVGVRTKETMRSLGRTAITIAEVTEYSDSCTGFRSVSGPVVCDGSREFLDIPSGTRMTYSLALRPSGFLKLVKSLLAMVVRRQVVADMRRLKRLLEEGR
jgi:hypothetical protein